MKEGEKAIYQSNFNSIRWLLLCSFSNLTCNPSIQSPPSQQSVV